MAGVHAYCPVCNYSAPPNRIKTERKHFDWHALECTRCAYRTETTGSFASAARLWDERAAQTGAGQRTANGALAALERALGIKFVGDGPAVKQEE